MFDESLVVQSAISAFNNAALAGPAFFWTGLLSLPLLALVYFYGADFVRRIGWQPAALVKNSAVMTIAVVLIWLISFGGNYGALRDMSSTLPFVIAAIVFVCTGVMGAASRTVPLPVWREMHWRRRGLMLVAVALITFLVGLSAMPTWWGILMQVVVFWGGLVLGRVCRRWQSPDIMASILIMGAVATSMLMQPEFFRFGQLGALTIVHLGALGALGVSLVAVIVLRNVAPRGRIWHSAYIKLKWLLRFMAALGGVLFVLTESVPLFLGTVAVIAAMFAVSVWHAKEVQSGLDMKIWAVALGLFGLVTTLPVISALGVMVWMNTGKIPVWQNSKFLL